MHTLNKKNQDMMALEAAFLNIKTKSNIDGNLDMIRRILKRQFDINFNISIVNNKTNQFFGMSIYPARNIVDTIVDGIINKKSNVQVLEQVWSENKDWFLEIDSLLLDDLTINVNPAELVAVLLHEIGHVVYSNAIPNRLNKVIRYELLHIGFNLKKLVAWRKAQQLFDLVVVEACSSKNYHYIGQRKELAADKFVVKMGYGDNLNEFIEKLLKTQGNGQINRSESEMEKDVRGIVTWSLENISELEFRKTKLRSTLQTEILQNPSRYVRGLVYDIKAAFFGGSDEDNYKELITEQYLVKEHQTIVKEGLLDIFDKIGKMKKISQSDIDIIDVERGRIENEDDKIYVLDLIYDKLDRINVGLDLINQKKAERVPMSKDTLLKYKAELEKMRKEVLAIQLKDKQYGVFIKYPKGYEG